MARIAFIGIGSMGKGMARCLLDKGHEVLIHNRSQVKAQSLREAGASVMASPAAAAASAEFIFSMVADDEASRHVWLGPEGILAGRPETGVIAVECSTLSHDWIMELNERATGAGLRFMDCPVTGGPDGAVAGTLKVLAGADPATLAESTPVLIGFAEEIIHFGPVGSGTSYKLIVNLMGAAQAAALAEGLLLAERAGLDLEKVGYALGKGTVSSPHVKYLIPRMLHANHDDIYYPTSLRYKDAAYALALAAKYQLELPGSNSAGDLYRRAVSAGMGEKNSTVILEILRAAQARAGGGKPG